MNSIFLLILVGFLAAHGYVPSNSDPEYFGFVGSSKQNQNQIGEYVIKLLIEGIYSRNLEVIGRLLTEKFYFSDCKGTFMRKQFLILVTSLPPKSKLTYKIKKVEQNGDYFTIEATISLISHGGKKKNFETVFYFNNEEHKFENGGITNCKS